MNAQRSLVPALVRKDLRVMLSDRRAVMISFLVPIALASFMALILGGSGAGSSPPGQIAIRVTDLDQTALSKGIAKKLQDEKSLDVALSGEPEARDAVRRGKAVAAVVIPSGFGDAAPRAFFGASQKPALRLLHDPSHGAEIGMVRGILMQHVMHSVSQEAFQGTGGIASIEDAMKQVSTSVELAPGDKTMLQDMFTSILRWQKREAASASEATPANTPLRDGLRIPFETTDEVVMAGAKIEQFAARGHVFAGMVVQFILFSAIEAAVGLLTERQRGQWNRIRAAPVSRRDLLLGKVLSTAVMGLLTTVVVFSFGGLVFGLRIEGSVVGFILVAASYALTAAAFGLLIAALGKSPQAARGFSILVVLMMVMLGGAWMPSFLFPPWLQSATLAIPTRWAVDGFDGTLWRGLTLIETLPAVGALLGFAVVFGGLAAWRFRWNAD